MEGDERIEAQEAEHVHVGEVEVSEDAELSQLLLTSWQSTFQDRPFFVMDVEAILRQPGAAHFADRHVSSSRSW